MPYEKVGKNEINIQEELPFDIPKNWCWTTIEYLSYNVGNKENQILTQEIKKDGVLPVVSQGQDLIDGFCNDQHKMISDIPVVMFGDHTRNVKYIDFNFVIGADGTKFHKIIIAEVKYIYYWMQYAANQLCDRGYARHYTLLKKFFLPLPPLAEQKRIVAKIKELLPHIEEYGKAESKVSKLNAEFPEKLKKSILQWAIQGKLVPQNPDDEPASVLLERIRAEKAKLIKEGKIKKDKNESIIFRRDNSHYEKLNGIERCIDDEIPFEIPENWGWTRLGTLVQKLTDGTHFTPKYTASGIPFLSVKDISSGKISFDNVKYISQEEHNDLFQRCDPQKGDILLTKVGTTGIPVLIETDREFSLFVSVALLKYSKIYLYGYFLVYLLQSPLVQNQCAENTKGVGNKNWVMKDISQTLLAIPPLAEQKRIVAEIEKIFKIQTAMRSK